MRPSTISGGMVFFDSAGDGGIVGTVTGGGEGGGGYAGGKGIEGSHCGCTSADHGGTNGNAPAEVPCRQRITGKGSSKGKGKSF